MSEQFKAGVGRRDITPAVGAILAGYAPGRPSTSVHDPLHFTAFAFEKGGHTAIVATADLLYIEDPLMSTVRSAMSEKSGVPIENIIVCAIHTHSGPAVYSRNGYTPDTEYLYHKLVPAAAEAAEEAVKSLRPAVMGISTIHSDVGVNRREIREDGSVALGQNPFGSYDPTMTVISFKEPGGRPIGNMIHYGAHNTGSGINGEITRDWCGVMIDRLEEVSGGVTAFYNGCEGDVGPRLSNGKTTGNLALALELGGVAANDAVKAWRQTTDWRTDADVAVSNQPITLPFKPLQSSEEIEKRLREIGDPERLKGLPLTEYKVLLERWEAIKSGKKLDDQLTFTQTVVSVGPVAFVALPFEVFSGITLRLSAYSPFPHTLSLSNANGEYSYFPSEDQICRGGYEVWMFSSMRIRPFVDQSEQIYIDQTMKELREHFDALSGTK